MVAEGVVRVFHDFSGLLMVFEVCSFVFFSWFQGLVMVFEGAACFFFKGCSGLYGFQGF